MTSQKKPNISVELFNKGASPFDAKHIR